jgi:hypothetical protein
MTAVPACAASAEPAVRLPPSIRIEWACLGVLWTLKADQWAPQRKQTPMHEWRPAHIDRMRTGHSGAATHLDHRWAHAPLMRTPTPQSLTCRFSSPAAEPSNSSAPSSTSDPSTGVDTSSTTRRPDSPRAQEEPPRPHWSVDSAYHIFRTATQLVHWQQPPRYPVKTWLQPPAATACCCLLRRHRP